MFTANDMQALLKTRPFVPFRLIQSDGGAVEVRTQEAVVLGKRWAVIGLLDPDANDTLFDRFSVVSYLHIARVEHIDVGPPPFMTTPGSADSPSPTPV